MSVTVVFLNGFNEIEVVRCSFQGQYLPSLSIYYVITVNKDMEKLPQQLYYKDENLL